jgi:type IV pilus assembly protein PilY1
VKRKISIIGIIFLIIVLSIVVKNYIPLQASSPSELKDYTSYPPFISQVVPPNVLLLVDNSGSMYEFAYKESGKGGTNPDKTPNPDVNYSFTADYYGYFDSNAMYKYNSSGGYFELDSKTLDRTSFSSGNFLNWLTMRRVDVVRKVLTGGKATNRNTSNPRYLVAAEDADRDFWKKYDTQLYYIYSSSGNAQIRVCNDSSSTSSCKTGTTYNIKIYAGYQDPEGIIQKTADKLRYGLMFFNTGNKYEDGKNKDSGYIAADIGAKTTDLVSQIESINPSTWTPLGESLYEAIRYFEATSSAYNSGSYSGRDSIQYWCQKNFVLILTDGESTKDRNVPGTSWTGKTAAVTDSYGFNIRTYMDSIASNEGSSSQWSIDANSDNGTYYLEGVSYYAHTNDLRSSSVGKSDIEGMQNLTTYIVYAFDESRVGKPLLEKTAKYGAFVDRNENNRPDLPSEWDKDSDGEPDTYFEAMEGGKLEASLMNALASILNLTASGTAASVLSTTGEGEGAIYQAYFYPNKFEGSEERTWLGYIHALFLDPYGNLREDTDGDGTLSLEKDYIVQTQYDPAGGTFIKRYKDDNGDGKIDGFIDKIPLDDVHSIWNAGKRLWDTDSDKRNIYTTINGYELESFVKGAINSLKPYLRASDNNEAEAIIRFIRGEDNLTVGSTTYNYRPRTITVGGQKKVWKLGDIIYSTPTVVSRPMENYDLIYGDQSYFQFRQKYFTRRHVVYVGANDGMLHAFNGGFYDTEEHRFSGGAQRLGDELWAFIPRELLPHLKWLTDPNYTHVNYVDLKPKVTDVKIFNNDEIHPEGWGTILIGGMRYGGKAISTEVGTLRSTYFALDVTDPEKEPKLLWTFDTTDSGVTDLGLSMSYPAVAKVGDQWYAIFGSGPTNFDQLSNLTEFQEGKIFVLKISGGSNGVIKSWGENYWAIPTGHSDAFMASPTTIDVNADYNADASYIGVNYKESSKEAAMLRLTTKGDTDVTSWKLSHLYTVVSPDDISKRITASPSALLDSKGKLWVYFGTGQFLGADDRNQTDSGAFYGIKDECWDGNREGCPKTYSNLLDVTNAIVYFGGENITGVEGVKNWSELQGAVSLSDGWAIYFGKMPAITYDFLNNPLYHKGERVTTKPTILAGLLMFATYIPGSDICTIEGESNLYVLYYSIGTAYYSYVFKKEKEKRPETVSRAAYLGKGLPASIGLAVTKEGQIKGFVQSSTGNIQSIQELDPSAPRSGYTGWKVGGITGP